MSSIIWVLFPEITNSRFLLSRLSTVESSSTQNCRKDTLLEEEDEKKEHWRVLHPLRFEEVGPGT
jgi:hypothetical protein